MIESIKSFFLGVYDHYAALTGIVFIAAILKFAFPIFMFFLTEITNRISEKKSAKDFIKRGISEEQAKEWAKNIWRPKKEQTIFSKYLDKLMFLFKKKK